MKIQGQLMYFRRKESEMSKKFEVTLAHLSDADVARLAGEKIIARTETDPESERSQWGNFIVARSNFPVKLFDAKKNPITEDTRLAIGNGTVVNAVVAPFSWDNSFGSGVSVRCTALQILTLVEYDPDSFQLEEEEGFESPTVPGLEELDDEIPL